MRTTVGEIKINRLPVTHEKERSERREETEKERKENENEESMGNNAAMGAEKCQVLVLLQGRRIDKTVKTRGRK